MGLPSFTMHVTLLTLILLGFVYIEFVLSTLHVAIAQFVPLQDLKLCMRNRFKIVSGINCLGHCLCSLGSSYDPDITIQIHDRDLYLLGLVKLGCFYHSGQKI